MKLSKNGQIISLIFLHPSEAWGCLVFLVVIIYFVFLLIRYALWLNILKNIYNYLYEGA